jgi:MFS family permease
MWLGFRYVTHSAPMIAVLVRALAFVFCASVLYALLPLVARQELGLTAWGYGMILGFVGAGAIAGAAVLPTIRSLLGADARVVTATAAFAVSVFGLAFVRDVRWLCPLMILAGFSWLTVLSGLNVAVQSAVPSWVRGRALSVYLLVFFGGMALGALSWGSMASIIGIPKASCVAGLGLLAGLLTTFRFRLSAGENLDLTPSGHWPVPAWCEENARERQPLIVTIEYTIDPKNRDAFLQAVRPLRDLRLRDGAYNWSLARNTGDPSRYIEVFFVQSWVEHLRQHQRVTVSDRQAQEKVQSFHIGRDRPVADHFVTESVYKSAQSS